MKKTAHKKSAGKKPVRKKSALPRARNGPGRQRTRIAITGKGVKADLPSAQARYVGEQLRQLFSPVVEGAGLIGDYIHFFRQAAAIRAMKKVQEIALEKKIKLKPVPPKFLVPWVEAVSIEDPQSPLIEWWANLMIQRSLGGSARPYLVDLMTKIGTEEAVLLDQLWTALFSINSRTQKISKQPILNRAHVLANIEPRLQSYLLKVSKVRRDDSKLVEAYDEAESFISSLIEFGDNAGVPLEISMPFFTSKGGELMRKARSPILQNAGPAADVCFALNILRDHVDLIPLPDLIGIQARCDIRLSEFTELGVEFMNACRPRAADH